MRKIYRALCKAEVVMCGVGFIFLVAFVFLSAILRFFRISVSWNIDLAMFLLAWTAFLGADIAWRSGQLVGVDLITRRLPRNVQKIIEILLYCVVLSALSLIVVFGVRLAITERLRTYQSIPIPYSFMTISLVVAGLSMIFSTILKIRRRIINFNKKETAGGAK
ncbi:MAG: TRAP transporter small permease subunit [Treponema sp.]|jgi:TRAP-type C4-dicarboxylate transport system permease small subunit|nr:TRAP transporter small permease subunit [Treponema sp.]